jgi:hypothetical protein
VYSVCDLTKETATKSMCESPYSLFDPEAFHTGNYTEILRADM